MCPLFVYRTIVTHLFLLAVDSLNMDKHVIHVETMMKYCRQMCFHWPGDIVRQYNCSHPDWLLCEPASVNVGILVAIKGST